MTTDRRIALLEAETDSVNREVQDSLIPYFAKGWIKRVFDYHFNGKELKNKFHELVFATDMIKFNITPRFMNRPVEGPVPELVRMKVIQPFLLFINNAFIKWSNIVIKYDARTAYICITGADYIRDVQYIPTILQIPFNIQYTENNDPSISGVEIFRFDDRGLSTETGSTVIYMNPYSDIYFESVDTAQNKLVNLEINIPDNHKLRPENFIVFKNGLLFRDFALEISPLNIINMDFKYVRQIATYKIFYHRSVEYNNDNLQHMGSNHDFMKEQIKEYNTRLKKLPEVYTTHFDFKKDPTLSDYRNMVNATDYVARYNSQLLEKNPETIAEIVTKTGAELREMIDDNHTVRMLRYTARPTDNCVLIFKNGLLYNRYFTIKYQLHTFTFKLYEEFLEDEDIFEFVFYKNIRNTVLEDIPVDDEGYIPYEEATLPASNITILCSEASENRYTVLDTGYAYYRVDFTVEGDKLKVTDPFYYGKTVTIITKNHFEHARYTMSITSNRVYLGGTFKYYYDLSNYMVFKNGRKINPGFRIVEPKNNSPVHGITIYLELEYEKDDYIDVFYLPEGIKMDMLRPTWNLVRRVYTHPSVMQYKIPVPYDDFFEEGNYVDITNEYGYPIKNMVVDYKEKTVTFLAESRVELAFDYKFEEFMARIRDIMDATDEVYKNINAPEIVEHDVLYYTNDPAVIEKAHQLVYEFFGNERAGILRLFHRMVDDAYNGPSRIEWSLRDHLVDQFTYVRCSDILPVFMDAIADLFEMSELLPFRCWDEREVGFDNFYYTTDPEVITRAHKLVDEVFEHESDAILTLFHRMVDDALGGPNQIEWALRKNLGEMFLDSQDSEVDYKDLIEQLNYFVGQVGKQFNYEDVTFKAYDSSEIGTDRIYYTSDPYLIEKAHKLVDERFAGQPKRITDLLHKLVDDSYETPSKNEWALRDNLAEMFIYIPVHNRIDAWIEEIYSICRSKYAASLDDVVLYNRAPVITQMLHDSVDEWFGEEPKYIVDLFHRMVNEAFRKPSLLKLSLRFKLSSMFWMLPYVIVFYFRYRGSPIGLQGTGYIRIRRYEAPIGIAPETVLVFVNGKKVLQSDLMNISSSLMKVTKDIQSIQNLNVVRIANPEEWPVDVSKYRSIHDDYMLSAKVELLNNLHDTYNIITDVEPEMIYDIEPEMITNAIIADFYLDQHLDGEPFKFVYKPEGYFQRGNEEEQAFTATILDNRRKANIVDNNEIFNP
ncbi:MAG: FCD domain-containing protein [Pseudobutyrivibrio sp.]|nr:FCD domain-containing protein [Pseudobutyrivibrio sp.]